MKKTSLLVILLGLIVTPVTVSCRHENSPAEKITAETEIKIADSSRTTQMTAEYAASVARTAYVWGWPLVNMQNRLETFKQIPVKGFLGGVMPVAPVNELSMYPRYAGPEQKDVAHPNQDVFYGFGITDLSAEPVVVQVPEFDGRFWMYGLMNQRTDAFGSMGSLNKTAPGFYLIAGPDWKGEKPEGIAEVIISETDVNAVIPRVFVEDDKEDQEKALQFINQIAMYPLSKYDGKFKTIEWKNLPVLPEPVKTDKEKGWVKPSTFFATLQKVIKKVAPMPGEEVMYSMIEQVLTAAETDEAIQKSLLATAEEMEHTVIDSLFYFPNVGVEVKNHWTRPFNNGEFGLDFLTRTAIAKSNIFTNHFTETAYFYQYFDGDGDRLNGKMNKYTLTFPKGSLPPTNGFWSLTMYDEHHFFCKNSISRYSLGTKSKNMKYNNDGSLTIYIQNEQPENDRYNNWLPAPKGKFAVTLRCYGPQESVVNGNWAPPALKK